jgi:hypothetical protein
VIKHTGTGYNSSNPLERAIVASYSFLGLPMLPYHLPFCDFETIAS